MSLLQQRCSHPNHFGVHLDSILSERAIGHYAFRIVARERGGYEVQSEECVIQDANLFAPQKYFRVVNDKVTNASVDVAPVAACNRLYLVSASGLPEFRAVYAS